MARRARQESPSGYYHVMMRGNNREHIFNEHGQKKRFISTLKDELDAAALQLGAWCLMNNHVHLVIKGELAELSGSLKRVNISFAMVFNKLEDRVGHVFQDRFKSQVIASDEQLLAVVRYVHNNPVKAGLVRGPRQYPWSSYRAYLYGSPLLSTEQQELVLGYFDHDLSRFRAFHRIQDNREYLDTKEDIVEQRWATGQQMVADFCRDQGMTGLAEVREDPVLLQQLTYRLASDSKLTRRRIAELLGITPSRVQRMSAKQSDINLR